jgi:hypothetical protein
MNLSFTSSENADLSDANGGPGSVVYTSQDVINDPQITDFVNNLPSQQLVLDQWDGRTGIIGGSLSLWLADYGITKCIITTMASNKISISATYSPYKDCSTLSLIGEFVTEDGCTVIKFIGNNLIDINVFKLLDRFGFSHLSHWMAGQSESQITRFHIVYNPTLKHRLSLSTTIIINSWIIIPEKLNMRNLELVIQYEKYNRALKVSYNKSSCNFGKSTIDICSRLSSYEANVKTLSQGGSIGLSLRLQESDLYMFIDSLCEHQGFAFLKDIDPDLKYSTYDITEMTFNLHTRTLSEISMKIITKIINGITITLHGYIVLDQMSIYGRLLETDQFVSLISPDVPIFLKRYVPDNVNVQISHSTSYCVDAKYSELAPRGIRFENFNIRILNNRNQFAIEIESDFTVMEDDCLVSLSFEHDSSANHNLWQLNAESDDLSLQQLMLFFPNSIKMCLRDLDLDLDEYNLKVTYDLMDETLFFKSTSDLVTIDYMNGSEHYIEICMIESDTTDMIIDDIINTTMPWVFNGNKAKLIIS